MKTANIALLGVLVLSSLGIWGCAQQTSTALQRKMSDLEARYATLEDEYRNAVAANESNRRKLGEMETQRAELVQQVEDLKVVVQERDELKQKLAQRTNERDTVHAQLTDISKELLKLANRAESAASVDFDNVTTVTVSRRGN